MQGQDGVTGTIGPRGEKGAKVCLYPCLVTAASQNRTILMWHLFFAAFQCVQAQVTL